MYADRLISTRQRIACRSAGGSGYKASVTHYFESSAQVAGGAVQPGSEEDLAKIVSLFS